jgi:hypothetical protein
MPLASLKELSPGIRESVFRCGTGEKGPVHPAKSRIHKVTEKKIDLRINIPII